MPPYDRQRLLNFVSGDAVLVAEIAALFMRNGVAYVEALRQSAAFADGEVWYETAHKLKGTALAFGANALAAACAEAEKARADPGQRPRAHKAVAAAFQELCAAIAEAEGIEIPPYP